MRLVLRLITPRRMAGRSHTTMKERMREMPTCTARAGQRSGRVCVVCVCVMVVVVVVGRGGVGWGAGGPGRHGKLGSLGGHQKPGRRAAGRAKLGRGGTKRCAQSKATTQWLAVPRAHEACALPQIRLLSAGWTPQPPGPPQGGGGQGRGALSAAAGAATSSGASPRGQREPRRWPGRAQITRKVASQGDGGKLGSCQLATSAAKRQERRATMRQQQPGTTRQGSKCSSWGGVGSRSSTRLAAWAHHPAPSSRGSMDGSSRSKQTAALW